MGNVEGRHHLEPEEVEAVRAAWIVVRKDQRDLGRKIMMELFSENPDYIKKFRHLATIPADQLPYHNRLAAHALAVLYVLHSLIDSMDDEETLRELIRKKFEQAFMAVVSSSIDAKTKIAFEKCFAYFIEEYEAAEDLDV